MVFVVVVRCVSLIFKMCVFSGFVYVCVLVKESVYCLFLLYFSYPAGVSGGPLLVSGQGLGQGLGQGDSALEGVKIHRENQARLEGMTQEEILEEQRRLLAQLGKRESIRVIVCWLSRLADTSATEFIQHNAAWPLLWKSQLC